MCSTREKLNRHHHAPHTKHVQSGSAALLTENRHQCIMQTTTFRHTSAVPAPVEILQKSFCFAHHRYPDYMLPAVDVSACLQHAIPKMRAKCSTPIKSCQHNHTSRTKTQSKHLITRANHDELIPMADPSRTSEAERRAAGWAGGQAGERASGAGG